MDLTTILPWFTQLNGLETIGAIIMFALLLGLSIFIPIAIKKGISIKKKKVYCEDEIDSIIKTKVDEALKLWEKKSNIAKKLVDEQMSAADKSMVFIKQIIMDNYKTLQVTDRDIRHYSKIIDSTLNDTKNNKLKEYIKANHFLDKSDAEFREYKKIIEQTLTSYHIDLLDDEYYSEDFSINRKDLLANNQRIMHDIKDEINRLFDELKDIAQKCNIELLKVER